jgi:hypothetical protein
MEPGNQEGDGRLRLHERIAHALAPSSAPSVARVWTARFLAVGADALQLFLLPLFGEGFASPLNDGLDLVVGAILVWLVGFHWVFLPSLAAELVPGVDLAPTWTAAVLIATGGRFARGRRLIRWIVALVLVAAGVALAFWLREHQPR